MTSAGGGGADSIRLTASSWSTVETTEQAPPGQPSGFTADSF